MKDASKAGGVSPPDWHLPRTEKDFEALRAFKGYEAHEAKHKPFSPLPEGEAIPSMGELWAHAHRKYGRFQGYAMFAGIATAGLALAASSIAAPKPPKPQ